MSISPSIGAPLPHGWKRTQLRRLVDIRNGRDYKAVEVAEGGYPVYGSGGEFRRASDFLYDGESILFGRKGTVDRPLYVDGKFWTVDTMYYAVPLEQVNGRFLYYLSTTIPFNYYVTGTALPSVTQSDLAGHPVNLPPLDEQRAIADYLDRETQKIDELIDEQRGLIETLESRRQATIEASVFALEGETVRTQRTEPWLPSLPATWEVKQLGFVTETQPGYAFQSGSFKYDGSGTRLLRGINVKPEGVDWSDRVTWDEVEKPISDEFMLRTGDVVLGMDRPFVGSGIRVTTIKEMDLPALLVQRVLRVRATAEMCEGYLRYLLGTSSLKKYLEPLFTGVSVPHISEWQVRKFVVPVPPLEDQLEIAGYLDEQTSRIDELIADSEDLIALSQERRAALITAAVTGQIDVRNAS